jgi:aspartate/methionine/tyrosine aminotransferase
VAKDDHEPSHHAGRFPPNEIISLLDMNRPLNLAESTARDLTFGDVMALIDADALAAIKLGYGTSAGLPALRHQIARLCGVVPEAVVTTQGTALALFLLAFELCRPDDEVVLATPCFPPSRDALSGCGITVRDEKLEFEEGYRLDVNRLARQLTTRTRLVSIATPQNPSGVALDRSTVVALIAQMKRKAPNALLFIDETYREAAHGDRGAAESFAALDAKIITASSISKAHGAPGLRVGWMTVPDVKLRERLIVAKMNIVISGSTLDETLAAAIMASGDRVLGPRRALLARTLAVVTEWQAKNADDVEWVRPDAGALCCMRLRRNRFDDAAVARFWGALPELDLQLACGTWFGEDVRVFRLGFGYLEERDLPQALAAIEAAIAFALETVISSASAIA